MTKNRLDLTNYMKQPKNEKTIEHIWTILSEGASIDNRTNNLTLFHIIEQLQITLTEKKPQEQVIAPVNLQLTTLWRINSPGESIKADVAVEIMSPKGDLLDTLNYKLEIPPKVHRMRSIGSIRNLKVAESGNYHFLIKVKPHEQKQFSKVGDVVLEVHVSTQK